MPEKENRKTKALAEIQKVLALSEEVSFNEGEMIFKEGDEDPHFYIILKGNIEISKKTTEGQPKVIAQIGAGEFLGEGVLSGVLKKPASAKAVTNVKAMAFPREKFEKLSNDDPKTAIDFLLSVLEAANSRLNKTNAKLLAVYEINQLMSMYRDDLKQLASGLINKLMAMTDSTDGILLVKNPFASTFRIIYRTSDDLNEAMFSEYGLDKAQIISDKKGQFLIANLKDLGALALRRDTGYAPYDADQLRLLILIAEQAAHTIKEASEQAGEKARKMLERKRFEM